MIKVVFEGVYIFGIFFPNYQVFIMVWVIGFFLLCISLRPLYSMTYHNFELNLKRDYIDLIFGGPIMWIFLIGLLIYEGHGKIINFFKGIMNERNRES